MTEPRKKFLLGSEKEEAPRGDRLIALQDLRRRNSACEHVVIVGDGQGAATLALKMRGQDVCPHCTRREAAYWRARAKSAEGMQHAQEDRLPRCSAVYVFRTGDISHVECQLKAHHAGAHRDTGCSYEWTDPETKSA